jgi:hypothetical protein
MATTVSRSFRHDQGAIRRRRLLAALSVLSVLAIAAAAVGLSTEDEDAMVALVPRSEPGELDPLAYERGHDDDLERAATFGLSQPLYAKSPGGVIEAARRTAEFRPLVEDAVKDSGISADIVEAIVFLESGGRPEVIVGDDPARASGLTQILAETATSFLGMHVDLAESRRLTAQIRAAAQRGDTTTAARLHAERRAIDARFDPEQALAGTVRYLTTARERLGRGDLAVVSYHMGIGNLSSVLRAYVGGSGDLTIPELVDDYDLSWARVFFDTTPAHRSAAYALFAQLGDDSPTYYWRVLAAREIMRLFRDDPDRLSELDELHRAKASAEEVLHPRSETKRFADPDDLESAWSEHTLLPLPSDPARYGFAVDHTMGELAPQLGVDEELYRGLRPEALALLLHVADRVRAFSGAGRPLEVTSTVRDGAYQALLRRQNAEATAGYSLHTTGYAFDIRRNYESSAQARAFQFMLDDLTARGLIAWVREPAAIHVTVSNDAEVLVPVFLESEG